MSRPKKETKTLNIKIDAMLYNNLEKCCDESRRTKTAVVELALEEYFKNKRKTE